MNAYELADLIGLCGDGGYNQDAANMLRQQADQISVLEANYKIQVNIVEKQQDYIDQLEQGLRASIELNKAQAERQSKPLSDEEIADMVCSGEYWKVDGLTITSVDFDKFARAIEERHGIK